MKRKSKLKHKPLSEATPEQMREAFKIASLWLTDVLEGHTEKGAFSEKYLGEEARLFFPKRAYLTLNDPDTNWHWKEGVKLSTLMINVIKSDMAHTLRKYINEGEPDVIAVSEHTSARSAQGGAHEDGWNDANDFMEVDPDLKRNDFDVPSEEEELDELERYESRRNAGYHIARQAAKGDPEFEKYVEAAFSLPDQRSICKRMKMTKAEVEALEAELIVRIKVILAK